MTTKVVYNCCFGGFVLSKEAVLNLRELGLNVDRRGSLEDDDDWGEVSRHDPRLVQVIESLGEKASGACSSLAVTALRGDRYVIREYDGRESVVEPDDIRWISVKEGERDG